MNMLAPRMRTVPEAYKELKRVDENTSLTLSGLKRLVNCGEVPCVYIGRKKLINLDTLLSMLSMPSDTIKQNEGRSNKNDIIPLERIS